MLALRSSNLANWSDPRITFTTQLFLLLVAAAVSMILYFAPLRLLIYVLGLAVYSRVRKALARRAI